MKNLIIFFVAFFFILSCNTTSTNHKDKSDSDIDGISDSEDADGQIDDNSVSDTDEITDIDSDSDEIIIPDEISDEITDETTDSDADEIAKDIVCETLSTLGSGVCEVDAGNAFKLIKGNVLGTDKNYIGGQVLVSDTGMILCVGCDCDEETEAEGATVITCPQGVVSPALINAHDHIGWAHHDPKVWNDERFDHRHDWRIPLGGHTDLNDSSGSSADTKTWGELRNVMAGATTMAGSGGADGLLRNVDQNFKNTEGLGGINVYYETFPLNDGSGKLLESGCDYSGGDGVSVLKNDCYLPHVSEGITTAARNEFLCLSGAAGGVDLTKANSAFIHSIGLTAEDGEKLAVSSTAVIWSPRTNISLYGHTAQVTMFHNQGVLIGLGTDWAPTGSINMLREFKCVDSYNKTYLKSYFTDRQIWQMGTENNAVALRIADVTGSLRAGLAADIAIFDGSSASNFYRAVIESSEKDVSLVLRGGKPLYGDKTVLDSLSGTADCDDIEVCTVEKSVCVKSETGKTLTQLTSVNSGSYGLFFCGVPDDEPTCVPSRTRPVDETHPYTGEITTDDVDGDGIDNVEDNCPFIFNPVRPVDGTVQADADGDDIGDVCDPCPLVADSNLCTVPDFDDKDGDGIKNVEDNCPYVANENQLDSDKDWAGNACDLCPETSNFLGADCPTEDLTIYDIMKDGRPMGLPVRVQGIVTALQGKSFYIQVDPDDHDLTLEEKFSGIFVFVASSSSLTIPVLGDKVSVAGKVDDYYGQTQINYVTAITMLTAGKGVPDAVVVSVADVKTGGSLSDDYNSVLVHVDNVAVTTEADSYDEFIVTGDLRVDDYLYDYANPSVGTQYGYIKGILTFNFSNSKIQPRSAADMYVDMCIGVTCDTSWSQCNSSTGNCDAKEGFCAEKPDCPGIDKICNTTNHLCETGDPCASVTCSDEWMECNPELGACGSKAGRCNNDLDCSGGTPECNLTTHICQAMSSMIPNGSFELWTNPAYPDSWKGAKTGIAASGIAKETVNVHSGSAALRLENPGTPHKRFTSQAISVTAGSYTCKYWASGSGQIRNSYFGNVDDPNGYGAYTAYTTLASNTWQEITYNFSVPTDRTDFELIFSVLSTTATNGHVKVDDVVCLKD